mmetsp:Transcript_27471/g.38333  ORF Transcript_27471/g.38333 Transcript_27471/m.38333 type:complete len:239 (-) Transcript_27471:236-952(-)
MAQSRIQYLCVGNLEGVIVASENVNPEEQDDEKLAKACSRICKRGLHLKAGENILESKGVKYMAKLSKKIDNFPAVFICVTKSDSLSPKLVLRDFVSLFWKTVTSESDFTSAQEGSLTRKCQPVFKDVLKKHGRDKVAETNAKLKVIKNQMAQNVEQQLDNMENLEMTEQKANDLDQDAKKFKDTSIALKWKMCWQNAKWTIILVTTVVVILAVVITIAVCMTDPSACKSSDNNDNNN